MTIECYYKECPHHSIHDKDEGPFCYEEKCLATEDELLFYSHKRTEELIKPL